MTSHEIYEYIRGRYSEQTAESSDNTGRLIGALTKSVHRILVSLDFTQECLRRAIDGGFNVIVTHHPPIFSPIKSITDETPQTSRIIQLIKHDIALYTAHTNFDIAIDGTSATLAELFGLRNIHPFISNEGATGFFGRFGNLPAANAPTLADFTRSLTNVLQCDTIRFYGDKGKKINRAGICAGAAMRTAYWREAIANGCDVYITGDVKYHDAQAALDDGIAVIDITHDAGEIPAIRRLAATLNEELSPRGVTVEFFEQVLLASKA